MMNAKPFSVQVDPNVRSREYVKEGVNRTLYTQTAAIMIPGAAFPLMFELLLDEPDGYPVGEYYIEASSFTVDRGRLSIQYPRLVPCSDVEAAAPKPSALKAS